LFALGYAIDKVYLESGQSKKVSKQDWKNSMKKSDTNPEVQKRYDELWRKLTMEERFVKGLQLVKLSRALILAGIRSRNPQLSEQDVLKELRQQLYSGALHTKAS